MRNKILCLCLSLFMVVSYLPASVMTAFAAPIDNLETNKEDTSPKLILDKESNIKDVFVYKILDGSEYEKDAFGLISYTDSFKKDSESSKEFLEVDDFYSKLLDLFKDIKDLEDVNKKSSSDSKDESEKVEKEITQEDINKESLELYDEISEFLDESKQLQFNKDRELTDLTEGVYLIFSENMYPQFINITDSDKDVNIKLEENKSANEDAQKDISSNNKTPKATLKKSGPLRIASPDTEGLATNVEINKFDIELTGGTGELQTINGQQVYVVPTHNSYNSASEDQQLKWKLDYALSATGSYPAESIEIRIPRYYSNKIDLDNTTNLLNTSNSIIPPVPAYPNYNTSGFAYKYDSDTKEYVLTNVIELAGGASGFFDFSITNTDSTYVFKDETLQIPLKATINVQTGDEGLKTYNSNEINWMYDTDATAYNINELLSNKYDTWQDEWGPAPANADDYFYVSYVFEGAIKNAKQRYTVKIENSSWTDDFVYGYIKYQNSVSTQSSTGLKYSFLDTPYYGETVKNYYVNASTYKNRYPDSDIIAFDGNAMEDGVILAGDGSPNYNQFYTGVVLARYPKSIQNSEGYNVTNTITMTVHPYNGNDEDTTVTCTKTDKLKDITWETPPGEFDLDKSTYVSTVYGLRGLESGSSISNIFYRSRFIGSNYTKTVIPGSSLDDPNNYGKQSIHYEFVDDTLFLNGDSTLLGPGDYEFRSLYFGPLSLYDYVSDDSSGSYISQQLLGTDNRYRELIENGKMVCWGKYADGWHKLATSSVNASNNVVWNIEDTNLVDKQGSSSSFSSTYLSVTMPYLKLLKGTGCLGYKVTIDSPMYKVTLGELGSTSGEAYNTTVALLPSDRVKAWAHQQTDSSGYLYNLNTLNVTDAAGNNIALEGDIEYPAEAQSDINNVLNAINNKDTAEYNRPLFHDAVRTRIIPMGYDSRLRKDYSTGTNDRLNEVYKQPYKIYGAAESYSGLPVDEIVTNGVLNDDAYDYLVENNYIKDFTSDYIIYDLLPKGMTVDESTIKVAITPNRYTDSYTTSSVTYMTSNMVNLSSDKFTYEIIPNFRNSGRDLLKVTCFEKPGINVYQNRANRMMSLEFTGLYSWDSFFDYGTTLRNIAASKWGADSIYDGKSDDANYSGYTSEEKEIMKDLDPNANNPNFLYTYSEYRITEGVSGTSGLYKRVKGSSGGFEKDSMVNPQSTYQYKIRYAAESGTKCSKLVFYDSLENYTPDNFSGERWKGKLQNIDISQLQAKGVNPKIYYSSINNLDISSHQDLTDRSTWIPAEDWGNDLSNVKAFAIDCREKTNSDEFILGEKESLAIIVNMLSDVPNPNELYENGTKAYNNIYAYNKVEAIETDQTTESLIHQNYTSIGITVPTTKVTGTKKWKDENASTRPESITIELLRNGNPYREQTISASNNWKYEFNDLLKQDDNLVDYEYTVREKVVPTGYNSTVEPMRASGTSITFGNQFETESTSYDYVQIYYIDKNGDIKKLTGQGSTTGSGSDSGR